ncbi:MAG: hypothetical protein EXQ90_00395 [Rhodospirillales bacterium]|nr:hypothetical protein [Rhodospirillales bacterium]
MAKKPSGVSVLIPISPGELLDKITILEIKAKRIGDAAKLKNVRIELAALEKVRKRGFRLSAAAKRLVGRLRAANATLWTTEDAIRDCERRGNFGPSFIRHARAVYRTNDRRAELKRELNALLGSEFQEEKSYKPY